MRLLLFMASFKPNPIVCFEELTVDDFNYWIRLFNNYLICSDNSEKPDLFKISALEICGGAALCKVIDGLNLKEPKFDELILAFKIISVLLKMLL